MRSDAKLAQRPRLGRPPKNSPSKDAILNSSEAESSPANEGTPPPSEVETQMAENKTSGRDAKKPVPKPPAPSKHNMQLRVR